MLAVPMDTRAADIIAQQECVQLAVRYCGIANRVTDDQGFCCKALE